MPIPPSSSAADEPFHPFRGNFLLAREWRRVRRRGWRNGYLWLVLALAGLQTAILANWARVVGRPPMEGDFFLYMAAIQALILVYAPFAALRSTRRPEHLELISALRQTPLDPRLVFWWLWVKGMMGMAPVLLALLVPLLFGLDGALAKPPPPMSYMFTRYGSRSGDLTINVLMTFLLALPWFHGRIAGRDVRLGKITFSCLLACLTLFCVMTKFDTTPARALNSWRWLPIRIPQLILLFSSGLSLAWSLALGIAVGLRRPGPKAPLAVGCVGLGPGSDLFLFTLLVFLIDRPSQRLIYLFLIPIYAWAHPFFTLGALWLALKWNLFFKLVRLRHEPQDL